MLGLFMRSLLCLFLILSPAQARPLGVLVVYDSIDGHTQQLAHWVAGGAEEDADTEVRLKPVETVTPEDLLWADAILVGSPVYNAGLTPLMGKFLADLPFEDNPLKNKVGAAFVSCKGASAGEETAMLDILHAMLVLQMIPFGGDDWRSGFGVSYIRDLTQDPKVLNFTKDKALRLGRRAVVIARATRSLRSASPP